VNLTPQAIALVYASMTAFIIFVWQFKVQDGLGSI